MAEDAELSAEEQASVDAIVAELRAHRWWLTQALEAVRRQRVAL